MQTNRHREPLLLIALVLWVLFVLAGYYYWHKPINFQMVAPPLNAAVDLLFAGLFAGLAGGLGRALLRVEGPSRLEHCALQFALGAGMISFVWFGLGILGLYRFPLAVPILLLGLVLLRRPAWRWYADLGGLAQAWQHAGLLERVMAIMAILLLFFQLLIALAPPLQWDALAYHLQLPRQYLEAGRFFFTPENPYWGHPQLVEMLYTFALSVHRFETAAVLSWSAGVIFLIGLLGFTNTQAARLTDGSSAPAAGWAAVTAVLAGATFRTQLSAAYTDLFSALFGLAALVTFFDGFETRRPVGFWLGALFAGLALGTKWTAGVMALALIAAGFLFGKKAGLERKHVVLGGLVTALAVLPWLVKNLVTTGSPVYPYFFGTRWIDAARIASANPVPGAVDWWINAFAPVTTTWVGIEGAPGFSADLGPLLLLLAVPGFMRFWHDERVKFQSILLGIVLLAVGLGGLRFEHLMQTRLYYVALPAFAAAAGWGWAWLERQVLLNVRMRRIFGAVILLVMGLGIWQEAYLTAYRSPLGVVLGTSSPREYLERSLGPTQPAMERLQSLPETARILMLWEPRGLYAPNNAQADLWIDRWRTDRRELVQAPAILQRWRDQGFTHLLVFQRGVDLIMPQPGQPESPDGAVFAEMQALLPQPENIGGEYLLYTIP